MWYGHAMRIEEHYVGRMAMEVEGRRRLDSVRDDIGEGTVGEEVYDRATWRCISSYINPT